jgi:hypothetical protein
VLLVQVRRDDDGRAGLARLDDDRRLPRDIGFFAERVGEVWIKKAHPGFLILHREARLPDPGETDRFSHRGLRKGRWRSATPGPDGYDQDRGTKRTMLVEILGLPVAAGACSARPHDVVAARELLRDRLADLPRLRAIVGDRAYRGLARLARRKHLALDVKAPPPGTSGFVPIRPLYRIEHAFRPARSLAAAVTLL